MGSTSCDLEDGALDVVAVIEQRRAVQVDLAATDELPERARVRLAPALPVAEQTVGHAVGQAEKQQAEAAVEVEDAGELLDDRLDQPCAQLFLEIRENTHCWPASIKERAL